MRRSRGRARDRRAVLSAIEATAPAPITLLGLCYLTALPEQRILAAVSDLQKDGVLARGAEPTRVRGQAPYRSRYHLSQHSIRTATLPAGAGSGAWVSPFLVGGAGAKGRHIRSGQYR